MRQVAQDGDSSYHVRDRFRKELLVITVADILALPAFEQVQPLVLCEGAELREVHNVGILDCAPDKDGGYESYIPGEFIVTNLGFAHDDPELSERSLLVLIARGVSGIALKKAYRPIVSDRVRAASEAAGVPMYLYDGGYHEVVAYQALDLIRRDSEQSDKGRIMDGLLSGHDPHAARAALYELAGATGSTVQCIAASPKADDECSLYAMLDAMTVVLAEFKRDWDDVVEAVFAFRYHGALLALVSYAQPPAGVRTRSESDLTMRLLAAGQVHLGVGEETPLSDGDMSVREALAALKRRRLRAIAWCAGPICITMRFVRPPTRGACSGARPRCTGPCWKSTTIFTAPSLPRLPRRSRAPTATCVWRPRRCISIRTPFATACAKLRTCSACPIPPIASSRSCWASCIWTTRTPCCSRKGRGRRLATRRSMLSRPVRLQ